MTLADTPDDEIFLKVTEKTCVSLDVDGEGDDDDNEIQTKRSITFGDIGGLKKEIEVLKEMIDFQLLDTSKQTFVNASGNYHTVQLSSQNKHSKTLIL